jgi:hypothetical protein
METTEKIVEAYVRYIKKWFTIPNIKCDGQMEIDLLAIDTSTTSRIQRYHIESGISISGSYSKLTCKPFSREDLKVRVKQAGQRRTLGYFTKRKFTDPNVLRKLKEYGFKPGNYRKVIVTWGSEADVPAAAKRANVELWDFKDILHDIAKTAREGRTYFTDDTMRTLQLMVKAIESK